MNMACEFCSGSGGQVLWEGSQYRVIYVDEPGYPGFCRVVWNAHVKEMTDLDQAERACFLQGVFAVETALRRLTSPEKINLACLGNLTPHLHWHVIPRHADDPHFPLPIWAAAARAATRSRDSALPASIARELAVALGH
jgi:diadenosine tetraphosphate (Ap4A) HIT family hydrolase